MKRRDFASYVCLSVQRATLPLILVGISGCMGPLALTSAPLTSPTVAPAQSQSQPNAAPNSQSVFANSQAQQGIWQPVPNGNVAQNVAPSVATRSTSEPQGQSTQTVFTEVAAALKTLVKEDNRLQNEAIPAPVSSAPSRDSEMTSTEASKLLAALIAADEPTPAVPSVTTAARQHPTQVSNPSVELPANTQAASSSGVAGSEEELGKLLVQILDRLHANGKGAESGEVVTTETQAPQRPSVRATAVDKAVRAKPQAVSLGTDEIVLNGDIDIADLRSRFVKPRVHTQTVQASVLPDEPDGGVVSSTKPDDCDCTRRLVRLESLIEDILWEPGNEESKHARIEGQPDASTTSPKSRVAKKSIAPIPDEISNGKPAAQGPDAEPKRDAAELQQLVARFTELVQQHQQSARQR